MLLLSSGMLVLLATRSAAGLMIFKRSDNRIFIRFLRLNFVWIHTLYLFIIHSPFRNSIFRPGKNWIWEGLDFPIACGLISV